MTKQMTNNNVAVAAASSSSGVGFAGLLTIVFIALKLCGIISWSWLWVLSPLWIGLAIGILFMIIALLGFIFVAIVAAIVDSGKKKRR